MHRYLLGNHAIERVPPHWQMSNFREVVLVPEIITGQRLMILANAQGQGKGRRGEILKN